MLGRELDDGESVFDFGLGSSAVVAAALAGGSARVGAGKKRAIVAAVAAQGMKNARTVIRNCEFGADLGTGQKSQARIIQGFESKRSACDKHTTRIGSIDSLSLRLCGSPGRRGAQVTQHGLAS